MATVQRAMHPQKTKLQGQIISTQEVVLFAEKAGKNNEVLDENQSQQRVRVIHYYIAQCVACYILYSTMQLLNNMQSWMVEETPLWHER